MLRRIVRLLAIATCVLGGSSLLFLVVLDQIVMPRIVNVSRVTVPDVRGRTIQEAHRFIERMGLRLTVRDSVYAEKPAGRIIEQTPSSGQHIKRARRVFVDVSLGPRRYPVPDVTGGSLREAQLQIIGSQLLLGTTRRESSTAIPAGVVLRQQPSAATQMLRGSRVDLTISSGSPFEPKPVPNVIGMSIESVEDTLATYEMRLGQIDERIAEHVPPGQILAQQPTSNLSVSRHTPIDLVVSVHPASEPE